MINKIDKELNVLSSIIYLDQYLGETVDIDCDAFSTTFTINLCKTIKYLQKVGGVHDSFIEDVASNRSWWNDILWIELLVKAPMTKKTTMFMMRYLKNLKETKLEEKEILMK